MNEIERFNAQEPPQYKGQPLTETTTKITIAEITEITTKVFQFKDKYIPDKINTVKRYFYWTTPRTQYKEGQTNTYPIIIPLQVHVDITEALKTKPTATTITITKKGKDRNTRYIVQVD